MTSEQLFYQARLRSAERERELELGRRLLRIGYKAMVENPPPNEFGYRWTMRALKRIRKRLNVVA
jgi:hypothetical protein